MPPLTPAEVALQLHTLGVRPGDTLLVHTAYRAVRPVQGGPLGLITALRTAIGPQGTLVMPTMTDGTTPFDPRATPTHEMGITAELFWREPGVLRSTHPGASFAAQGPHAEAICQPQPLSPPHGLDSPVGRVYELDGKILLIGVHHSENTTLHLAEAMAGVPYSVSHPCVVTVDGITQTIDIAETDHCCQGFCIADAWLGNQQSEGYVGHAYARLMRARDLVAAALDHLGHDPLIFLCHPSAGCEECGAAWASVRRR